MTSNECYSNVTVYRNAIDYTFFDPSTNCITSRFTSVNFLIFCYLENYII